MSRFLSTIPTNHGFVGLGNVEAYPTGGSGPTAFGPTSYFGSDPRPAELGDNLNNPIDIGNFDPLFSSQTISGTHGGLTRRQSTFYKFILNKPRSIQVVQNFSTTAYTRQTNRNTLIAFYSYESDLGDGWEDQEVHNNPYEIRLNALRMGTNIIWYSMVR